VERTACIYGKIVGVKRGFNCGWDYSHILKYDEMAFFVVARARALWCDWLGYGEGSMYVAVASTSTSTSNSFLSS
jgi:hypothetical protein